VLCVLAIARAQVGPKLSFFSFSFVMQSLVVRLSRDFSQFNSHGLFPFTDLIRNTHLGNAEYFNTNTFYT